jgi:hypothetical protein
MDFVYYKPPMKEESPVSNASGEDNNSSSDSSTPQASLYSQQQTPSTDPATSLPSPKSPIVVFDFIHYVPPDGESRDADGQPKDMSRPEIFKPRKESSSAASAEEPEQEEGSTRPRLTKEQVAVLEKQFLDAPKPNSSTKRHLAEMTGLSIQRVGNWFQNRRAKAKQQKKWEELELRHHMELERRTSMQPPQPLSPDFLFPTNFFSLEMDMAPRRARSSFTLREDAGRMDHSLQQFDTPAEAAFASLDRCRAAAVPVAPELAYSLVGPNEAIEIHRGMSIEGDMTVESFDGLPLPPSAFSDYGSTRANSVAWTPAATRQGDPFDGENVDPKQRPPMPDRFKSFNRALEENHMKYQQQQQFLMPPLPSRLRETQTVCDEKEDEIMISDDGQPTQDQDESAIVTSPVEGPDDAESNSGPLSPIPSNPMSLAARRKRPRPAAINNAALRSQSFIGSFPASPTARGGLLGPASPMRRIKSAGTALNMRGRISKGSVTPSPRSPLMFSTFKEAGAFSDAVHANIARPPTSSSGSLSMTGSKGSMMAPPTPISPPEGLTDLYPSELVSQLNAADQRHAFIYNPDYPGSLVPAPLKFGTPPTTPFDRDPLSSDDGSLRGRAFSAGHFGIPTYGQSQHAYYPPTSPLWTNSPHGFSPATSYVQDEIVISPMFQSFPDMIHMPQPVHVSPLSSATESTFSPQTLGEHVDMQMNQLQPQHQHHQQQMILPSQSGFTMQENMMHFSQMQPGLKNMEIAIPPTAFTDQHQNQLQLDHDQQGILPPGDETTFGSHDQQYHHPHQMQQMHAPAEIGTAL